MQMGQICTGCKREIQYFENIYGHNLVDMLIEVPVTPEYQKNAEKKADKVPDSYWRCKPCRTTQLITKKCSKCYWDL